MIGEIAGQPQLIFKTKKKMVGLDPRNGKELWQVPYRVSQDNTIVTPALAGETLVTSDYDAGIAAWRIEGTRVRRIWKTREASLFMSSPVFADGLLVGLSHFRRGQLIILDPDDGRVLWSGKPRRGEYASLIRWGSDVLAFLTDGSLVVGAVSEGPAGDKTRVPHGQRRRLGAPCRGQWPTSLSRTGTGWQSTAWPRGERATRMRIQSTGFAVGSALAVLDRAAVVKRGARGENLAHLTVLPPPGELFSERPLPPGLSRLLAALIERFGVGRAAALDTAALAAERGITPETVRRGLTRLHQLERIEYAAAFRGRATELRHGGLPEDALANVDFEFLDAKRAREEDRLEEMVGYTTSPGCRVRYLLACFGAEDAGHHCGQCDRCRALEAPGRRTRSPAASKRTRETVLTALSKATARSASSQPTEPCRPASRDATS